MIPTAFLSLSGRRRVSSSSSSSSSLRVVGEVVGQQLGDYAPAATSLFNNMKLPAAVVTAGMISLGFATSFPELPKSEYFPEHIRQRCDGLRRLHIVVALIAVTSELIVVLWAAVEVNQLTERRYELAASVWDLIQRDCDLAWSAVNSHFVLGIIGFVTMLALRAYVMLLSAKASAELMTAASTGTGAALCLMIAIVNRGVQSGGGTETYRYGNTIFDLFQHYAILLYSAATSNTSPGPLQLTAILLELTSLIFLANVLLFDNGKAPPQDDDDDECPLIDIVDNTNNNENSLMLLVNSTNSSSSSKEQQRKKISKCLAIQDDNDKSKNDQKEEDSEDTSVSIY